MKLKHLRLTLGLTQEQAAEFFNLQPGYFAMIEQGRRELPQMAKGFMAKVKQTITSARSSRPAEKTITAEERSMYERHAAECLSKARSCARRLRVLERKYEKLSLLLTTAQQLKETTTGELLLSWLIYIERLAAFRLRKCSLFLQNKLRIQKEMFELEAAKMMALVE